MLIVQTQCRHSHRLCDHSVGTVVNYMDTREEWFLIFKNWTLVILWQIVIGPQFHLTFKCCFLTWRRASENIQWSGFRYMLHKKLKFIITYSITMIRHIPCMVWNVCCCYYREVNFQDCMHTYCVNIDAIRAYCAFEQPIQVGFLCCWSNSIYDCLVCASPQNCCFHTLLTVLQVF